MIALLAAVSEETRLIRDTLEAATEESAYGMTFLTGRLLGHEVCLTHGGIGKAAAASATISLLHYCQPAALVLFGCGGAYPNSGLKVGDLALADAEVFGDEGVETAEGFQDLAAMGIAMRQSHKSDRDHWLLDQALLSMAQEQLQGWTATKGISMASGPFVTVSTCTGTTTRAMAIEERTRGVCENMEGAAAALACAQMTVPMLELRGISNLVEDRDTSRWNLPAGMHIAQQAVLQLVSAWRGA